MERVDNQMKEYVARRWREGLPGTTVIVRDSDSPVSEFLNSRLDVIDYGASDFEWGERQNSGNGSKQLALALLCDAVGGELAVKHHLAFAEEVVARKSSDHWSVNDESVREWTEEKERS